jgi:hypothetical protein
MKVSVTPHCRHYDDDMDEPALTYSSSGEPFVGTRLWVNADGAYVDGKHVILRDRRAFRNREPGHPWVTLNNHPDPKYRRICWTGFTVEVEP